MPPFEEDIHVVVFVLQRQWGIYALLALFDFSAGIKAGGERNRLRKFVLSGSAFFVSERRRLCLRLQNILRKAESNVSTTMCYADSFAQSFSDQQECLRFLRELVYGDGFVVGCTGDADKGE